MKFNDYDETIMQEIRADDGSGITEFRVLGYHCDGNRPCVTYVRVFALPGERLEVQHCVLEDDQLLQIRNALHQSLSLEQREAEIQTERKRHDSTLRLIREATGGS